jgi:hypothetical protein
LLVTDRAIGWNSGWALAGHLSRGPYLSGSRSGCH